MLKHPGTDIDFKVTRGWFISTFDVYDREESLGERLNQFDPNCEAVLQQLFQEFLIPAWMSDPKTGYSTEHKTVVPKTLESALLNPATDFGAEFDDDNFVWEHSLPSEWDITNPKAFFVTAYRTLYEAWGVEIQTAGIHLTDPDQFFCASGT